MVQITEYRVGRNFVRLGDVVHITGPTAGKRGFDAVVKQIVADDNEVVAEVHVSVVTGKQAGFSRVVRPERVERKAQTRNGKPIEVRRPATIPAGNHKAGRR